MLEFLKVNNLDPRDSMKPREKQFISLKKAAEISGYSPDYVGYLIRQGKIKGKKIFANISWQTTPEEVIKYCKRAKNSDVRNSHLVKRKYLLLKEVAEISGYTSDYIGYLIRKGKIKGRKIYSGISWVTTEEAIKKYQEAKIQSQKETSSNFSPYLNLIIPQGRNKLFGFGWRLGLTAFVTFLLVSGFAPAKFLQNSIEAIFAQEIKTINFYTTLSTGDWRNPQNVQGPPEAGPLGGLDSFSETNSAVYESGSLVLVAEDFQVISPTNFDQKQFQSAKIKFSFAIGEKIPDFDLSPSPPSTTTTTTIPTTTTISVNLTAEPNSGQAPLNNVDLVVNTIGTATGTVTYYFNCGLGEDWDIIATTTEENYIVSGLCNFEEPNIYEAEVKVERGELETEATTTIEVSEPNHPPQAFDQNITLNENTSTTITLNATDTDGNSLSYSILSEPENGTLVADNLPEVTYSPNENYYGEDSFTFKASDGKAESNEATVNITIEQVNPPEQVSSTSTTSTNAELPIENLNNTATNTPSGTNDQLATSTDSSFSLEEGPTHFSPWGKVKNFFGILVVKTKKALAYLKFNLKQLIDIVFIVKAEEGTSTTATSTSETLPNLDTKIIIWYSLDGENWQILDTISGYPLSNALNPSASSGQGGGYFEYDISFLKNWDDVENLKIKFEGVVGGETNVTAYLDSIWVEVTYKEQATEEEQPQEEPQEESQEQPQEQPTEELTEPEEFLSEETPEEITEETSGETEEFPEEEFEEEPTEEEFEEEEIEEEETIEEEEQEGEERKKEDEKEGIEVVSEKHSFRANEEPKFRFRYNKIYNKFLTTTTTSDGGRTSVSFPSSSTTTITSTSTSSTPTATTSTSTTSTSTPSSTSTTSTNGNLTFRVLGALVGNDSTSSNSTNLPSVVPWEDINITSEIQGSQGSKVDIDYEISFEDNGEFSVTINKPLQFRPGLYKLIVKIEDKLADLAGLQIFEQDFTWGVLAINTSKSIYSPGEQAYLQMAALGDDGHTVCNANLELEITAPDGKVTALEVQKSGECGPNNVTDTPDYFAYYQTGEVGIYQMKLTNLDTGYEIEDSFEVRDSVLFDIERIGPTRIFPPATYEMTLKIKANQDFAGEIIETIPLGFSIQNIEYRINNESLNSNYYSLNSEEAQEIHCEATFNKDDFIGLRYTFDAPDVSPYLYLLGPLEFQDPYILNPIFSEIRQWQIASDAFTDLKQIHYHWRNDDGAETAFDEDGIIQKNPTGGDDRARAIADDLDYIYVAGYDTANGNQWRIEKRNISTGALCTSTGACAAGEFGSGGTVTSNPSAGSDMIYNLAIDSSYIYLTGKDGTGGNQWRIEKRNISTGALCTSTGACAAGEFGSGGIASNNPSSGSDQSYGITIDSNYVYIVGWDSVETDNQLRIEKRNINTGALCTSTDACAAGEFGSGGVAQRNPTSGEDLFYTVAVDDNYLYAAGKDNNNGGQWVIEKRNISTGDLCNSTSTCAAGAFDEDGIITQYWDSGGSESSHSIAIDSNYLYISGWDYAGGDLGWKVQKRNKSDGNLVSAFGSSGEVTSDPTTDDDIPYSIKVDSGYVYLGGYENVNPAGDYQWRIEKRNITTGNLCTSTDACVAGAFDGDGVVQVDPSSGFDSDDHVRAVTVDSGYIYITGMDVVPGNWQWRIEKRNIITGAYATSATSATNGNQDTALTGLEKATTTRLRIEISNEGTATSTDVQYRLEYGEKTGASCSDISTWVDVGAAEGDWDMSTSTYLTDGADTTNIATSTGGVSDENTTFLVDNNAVKDTSSQIASTTLTTSEFLEAEFSIEASTTATDGATYCFRLTNAGTTTHFTYTSDRYPEVTIAGELTNPNTPILADTPAFPNMLASTTTPDLGGFSATDPDGDPVEFWLEWDIDYNFSSPATSSQADYPTDAGWSSATSSSGATTTYTIQAGDALSEDTVYWWRVKARDPGGTNIWSSYSTKRSISVSSTLEVAQWFQTTGAQFNTDTLTSTVTTTDGVKLGGWSPFLYVYQNDQYIKFSDFIPWATSPEKEYTDFIDITGKTEIIDGKIKLKITEEMDERAYIDKIFLRVDGEDQNIVELSAISDADKSLLLLSDDNYLVIEKGDEFYLEFNAPENYSKIEFAAEGYYIVQSSSSEETEDVLALYEGARPGADKKADSGQMEDTTGIGWATDLLIVVILIAGTSVIFASFYFVKKKKREGGRKIITFLLILLIVTGWMFSGWPQIWKNPSVPPEVKVAQAAPVIDGTASTNFDSSTHTSISVDHTVSGSNTLLLVICHGENQTVSSVTFGAQSLTNIDGASISGNGAMVSVWYLVGASGTHTATCNLSSQDNSGIVAISYTGVDQTTPIGATSTQTGNNTISISFSFTTTYADSLIIDAVTGDGGDTYPHAPTSGQTERWDFRSGSSSYSDTAYAGSELVATTTGTYNLNWSQAVSDGYSIAAIELVPVQVVGPEITIGASGNQVANLNVGDTDKHIGGMFTATTTDDGNATMTAVTITEYGSVNAQTGLDNIELWYDLDTSSPYNCAGLSYSGDETQFGSTSTFSGPNGTSTFTDAVQISSTTAMCMYVVLDVTSNANGGDTIEIKINASDDVTIDGGSVSGDFPVEIDGITTIRADSGTVMSTEVDFDWVPNRESWGEVYWSTNEPSGSDIKLKVYYTLSIACDTLVPTSTLPGNDVGFDVNASPKNISGLSTSTYNRICLKAELTIDSATSSPTLDDWKVTWVPPIVGTTVSGTLYTNEGDTAMASQPLVRVKVDGGGDNSNTANTDGTYTVSGIDPPSAGQVLTVYLDTNGGEQAVTVTRYNSGSPDDIDLYQNRLIVREEDGTAISNADLGQWDGDNDPTDIFFTSNSNNLVLNPYKKLIVWGGDSYSPGGTITLEGNASSTPDGDLLIGTEATLTAGGTITLAGSWTASSTATFTAGSNTVIFNATTTGKTITTAGNSFYNLTFNGSGGEWTFQDAATTSATTTITQGTLSQGANNFVTRSFTIASSTTFTKATSSGLLIFEGSGIGYFQDDNATKNNLGNVHIGNSPATTNLSSDMTADSLTVQNGDTLNTRGYDLDITEYITINGTLNASDTLAGNATLINLGTNWTVDTGATFDAANSTTTFNGTTTSTINSGGIDNSHDFYTLTFEKSSTATTTLATSTKVSGDLLIIGSDSILDASSSNYNINVAGSWTNSGTFRAQQGTVTFDATTTGKTITAGGSDFYDLTFNGSGGGWTFQDTDATTTNNFTISAGTATSTTGTLAVGGDFDVSGGTFKHNNGTLKLFATSAGHTITLGSSHLYNLTFNGSGGGWSFATGTDPYIDNDFTITNGTATSTDITLHVGGSWLVESGGIFNHPSGTVTFDSSDTGETINPGNSPFNIVTFDNASGGWTIIADATSTSNWNITNATSFVATTSITIEVQGNYVISTSVPSVTDWQSNSTLYLNSASSYTVGSTTQAAETYATLKIGTSTDIRMWNSTSTSYDVDSSGSLYSQDHASNDGYLYIWGDFHTATGITDYWEYTKDFDGTALGSNRQCKVYIQQNATTTVDAGGTLNVKGGETISTDKTIVGEGAASSWSFACLGTCNIQESTWNWPNFTNGTTTVINTTLNDKNVSSNGVLNVDWYLGAHVVDANATSTDVPGATTTIYSTSTSDATIWKWSGGAWGDASTTQVTVTYATGTATGTIPQPGTDGAIRIREYSEDSATTTYYKYNLQLTVLGYSDYDYYNDQGNKYITSVSSTESSGVDKCISIDWFRSSSSAMNTPYPSVNEPPTNGSWYAGMTSDLEFSVDSLSVNLGQLDSGNDFTATGTTILYATTSYSGGYTVKAYASNDGRLKLDETNYIDRWPYANSTPALWSGNCMNNSECGFGYTTDDNSLGPGYDNRFATSTKYAGFATSTPGDSMADETSAVPSGSEHTITYKVSTAVTQAPGTYNTTVYYVCTANY